MKTNARRCSILLGGAIGATLGAIAALTLVFAGAGAAASQAKPEPVVRPSISGQAVEGQWLNGDPGQWRNNPTHHDYSWERCNANGRNCSKISGADGTAYHLVGPDVGHKIRFRVVEWNSDGRTDAESAATAVVRAAGAQPPPPPPSGNGCPPGPGPVNVLNVVPPARLVLDGQQSNPAVVTGRTSLLTVRYHVSDSCGQSVVGALVYTTAVPFNQFSIPGEQSTGSDGWATLQLHRLRGFPVSSHQQLVALFARARKGGEPILGGISTRRLFSVRVNLKG
jgi:hypothetical protein